MKKVLFLENIPSPYRVDFFTVLGTMCDLTVLFETKSATYRNDEWMKLEHPTFRSVFMKQKRLGKMQICTEVCKYLSNDYDAIIVGVYNMPTSILAMQYMRMRKISFYISIDGGMIKSESKLKKVEKTYLLSGANAWMSPSSESDRYLVYYGANPKKIFRYNFTSLLSKDIMSADEMIKSKDKFREELGIQERYMVLSVGRFNLNKGYGKGYDVLMKVAEKATKEIGFYFVGDEPTEEFVDWKREKGLENVHFISFLPKSEVSKYYASSDLFVLLTRGDVWGLVINEAMSYSLPIITTDKCVAGLELVEKGKNGYIVGAGEVDPVYNYMMEVIGDKRKREMMGLVSRRIIDTYSIEIMAEQHMRIFENGCTH